MTKDDRFVPGPRSTWLVADFNGMLASDLLCLAHANTARDAAGREVGLHAGMIVTAFDEDSDDQGRPDFLFATGVVEETTGNARCRGSLWSLRIDGNGVRWESDLFGEDRATWPEGSSARGRERS